QILIRSQSREGQRGCRSRVPGGIVLPNLVPVNRGVAVNDCCGCHSASGARGYAGALATLEVVGVHDGCLGDRSQTPKHTRRQERLNRVQITSLHSSSRRSVLYREVL